MFQEVIITETLFTSTTNAVSLTLRTYGTGLTFFRWWCHLIDQSVRREGYKILIKEEEQDDWRQFRSTQLPKGLVFSLKRHLHDTSMHKMKFLSLLRCRMILPLFTDHNDTFSSSTTSVSKLRPQEDIRSSSLFCVLIGMPASVVVHRSAGALLNQTFPHNNHPHTETS